MSTIEVPEISPGQGDGEPQASMIGGSKPLHRFIKMEPKCIGIVMLFLGGSQFILGIPMKIDPSENSADIFCPFWLGILFIISGVLYILFEQSPSKKLVTASLALSIISIIGSLTAFIEFISSLMKIQFGYAHHKQFYYFNHTEAMDPWLGFHMNQLYIMEAVFLSHCLVGMVLLIVMTVFARAALRSSKTQAIVIMHRPSN